MAVIFEGGEEEVTERFLHFSTGEKCRRNLCSCAVPPVCAVINSECEGNPAVFMGVGPAQIFCRLSYSVQGNGFDTD